MKHKVIILEFLCIFVSLFRVFEVTWLDICIICLFIPV